RRRHRGDPRGPCRRQIGSAVGKRGGQQRQIGSLQQHMIGGQRRQQVTRRPVEAGRPVRLAGGHHPVQGGQHRGVRLRLVFGKAGGGVQPAVEGGLRIGGGAGGLVDQRLELLQKQGLI